MRNAFASIVQARPCPTFGRPVHLWGSPFDYGPVLLLKPFRFHLTVDTLSSGCPRSDRKRTPFAFPGQQRITAAFGYSAPHPGARGTSTLPIWALPSTHYGPLRLPATAAPQVMDFPGTSSMSFHINPVPGLPGSSADLSARALLNHPGRPSRCSCSFLPRWFQTSPSPEGWPPPSKCNEAESGSLALGLAPSLSKEYLSLSPLRVHQRDRPTSRFRLPSTGGRNYMLNEQLTCMTPYSHIDQPGLSWRTGGHTSNSSIRRSHASSSN